LNETWSLDGFLVLLGVFLNHSVGVVSEHVNLNADLLVEANEAVVHDKAVELELAGATESLLHLELADIGVDSLEAFDLDDVLLGLGVDDDDVPVALLDEGVVSGVDVAGADCLGQLVVLNVDGERDDVAGRDGRLALHFHFLVNRHKRHHFDYFLKLDQLGLVALEESEFGALLGGHAAEGLDLAVGDLVLAQGLAVLLDLVLREPRQLKHRVVLSPQTLHEELLELNERLDSFETKFLD